MKNLFISGITGKVGKLLSSYALESNQFKLVGGSCSPDSTFFEKDVGELLKIEEKRGRKYFYITNNFIIEILKKNINLLNFTGCLKTTQWSLLSNFTFQSQIMTISKF